MKKFMLFSILLLSSLTVKAYEKHQIVQSATPEVNTTLPHKKKKSRLSTAERKAKQQAAQKDLEQKGKQERGELEVQLQDTPPAPSPSPLSNESTLAAVHSLVAENKQDTTSTSTETSPTSIEVPADQNTATPDQVPPAGWFDSCTVS